MFASKWDMSCSGNQSNTRLLEQSVAKVSPKMKEVLLRETPEKHLGYKVCSGI